MGLKLDLALQSTSVGVNFVAAELHLTGPAALFANGTAQLVYLQIEQPVVSNSTARLLQASNSTNTTNTTVAPVTGTGNFEGWSGAILQPYNATRGLETNKNSWGKRNFKTDVSFYKTFGGADAVNTTSSSAWQIDGSPQAIPDIRQGNATAEGHWDVHIWRLASAVDSLKFKIVPDRTYYLQAGHRYWAAKNVANATSSGDSNYISFKFDGATSTILGFGSLAAGIIVSMF